MTLDFYYIISSPPCRSVLLLAKTLGVELNLKKLDLSEKEHLKPEFLKINPQHCVPTLVDNGFVLWESRAILGYLVNQYGKDDSLYPKDPKKRAVIDQRLYFDDGTFFPRLRNYFFAFRDGKDTADVAAKLEEAFLFLDKFLEGQDWVAGSNISIADYSVVVNVSLSDVCEYDISKYPNVANWYSRVREEIVGFDEIQEAAVINLKKMLANRPK